MTSRVVLYTRNGCHLCEVAKQVMVPVLEEFGLPLEELDIDQLPEKRAQYGNDIPVVEIDGELVYRHRVPPLGFRKKIQMLNR